VPDEPPGEFDDAISREPENPELGADDEEPFDN
jgi:hypothetical protein